MINLAFLYLLWTDCLPEMKRDPTVLPEFFDSLSLPGVKWVARCNRGGGTFSEPDRVFLGSTLRDARLLVNRHAIHRDLSNIMNAFS
jgi:hypothetical protein